MDTNGKSTKKRDADLHPVSVRSVYLLHNFVGAVFEFQSADVINTDFPMIYFFHSSLRFIFVLREIRLKQGNGDEIQDAIKVKRLHSLLHLVTHVIRLLFNVHCKGRT